MKRVVTKDGTLWFDPRTTPIREVDSTSCAIYVADRWWPVAMSAEHLIEAKLEEPSEHPKDPLPEPDESPPPVQGGKRSGSRKVGKRNVQKVPAGKTKGV